MVPRRWRWVRVVPALGGHLAAFYFQRERDERGSRSGMKMGRTCPMRPPSDRAAALPDEAGPSALGFVGRPERGPCSPRCHGAAPLALGPAWFQAGAATSRRSIFRVGAMSGAHGRG